ncbi:MAG: phage tail protein [Nitrospira sp.]
MATGDRKDPYVSCQFLVEIDGVTKLGFRECSGLDSAQDPVEYREGNEGPTVRKLPGLTKYSNISLKRGVTDDTQICKWRENASEGKIERKNGSIILLDHERKEKVRWNFVNAWPTKWTGPTFNATANEVAIEQLDLAHEGVKRA